MDSDNVLILCLVLSLVTVFVCYSLGEKLFKENKNNQSIVMFFLGLVNFVLALGAAHKLLN